MQFKDYSKTAFLWAKLSIAKNLQKLSLTLSIAEIITALIQDQLLSCKISLEVLED